MPQVQVRIVRFIDSAQPGWVECVLIDRAGIQHLFREKVTIVTAADLNERSTYPVDGYIACEVIGRGLDQYNREVVTIDTRSPWAVESVADLTRFEIWAYQVVD